MDDGLRAGAVVLVRAGRWKITGVTSFPACASVRLHGCGVANQGGCRTLLTPFDRLRRADLPSGVTVANPRGWLRAVRRLASEAHPFGGLRTVAASGIDILPYQLEPALAIAAGATRVMIADAVGLGKTVQAGMILGELASEAGGSGSFRALVAVPAALRQQWAQQLASHYALISIPAGAAWLARMSRDVPAGVNPWILPGIYISSFDFLKRPEVLRPLEDVTWDALVVDEAHNASPGTARRAALHDIALRSRRVILLTATPHAGDTVQFDALCRIGANDGDSPLLIFRRSREDTGDTRRRRSVLLPVRLSAAERRMHRLLDDYSTRVCREAGLRADPRARLAAIVLRKRALSSAASLAASTERRLALLAGLIRPPASQLLLPLNDEDDLEDEAPDAILAAPGLSDPAEEQRLLRRIADAALAAAVSEAKLRVLVRFLTRAREPAIVFTEYRDTLMRLERLLASAGFEPRAIHGGQPAAERTAIQAAFNERGALLLATDAAAEGLNLQSRCRLVIHYELPWSPARIEQRTGRVDRIGQRRTVHEVLLVARDTAERLVLAPLARRAVRARSALAGPSPVLALLTESRIAAAVMDGVRADAGAPDQVAASPAADSVSSRAAVLEAQRLNTARRWMTGRAAAAPLTRAGPIAAVLRRRRAGARGVTCIYRASLASSSGRVGHCELIAMHDVGATMPASRAAAAVRQALDDWLVSREPAMRAAATAFTVTPLADAATRLRTALASSRRREIVMARARPSAARTLVQAGLFDSRAVRAHQARHRSAGALLEESEARIASLASAHDVVAAIELVAVLWPATAAAVRREEDGQARASEQTPGAHRAKPG